MANGNSTQFSFAVIFGGVIAFVLLALYASIVGALVWEVFQIGKTGATPDMFGKGAYTVVTTIGGLISALVVSKLAITKPGKTPSMAPEPVTASEKTEPATASKQPASLIAKSMAVLYLTVWVAVGLAALIVGKVFYEGTNSTVEDIGTSWLGLAIAAGYAYFGLDPSKST